MKEIFSAAEQRAGAWKSSGQDFMRWEGKNGR